MEDKQEILDALTSTLQLTRDQRDLIGLRITPNEREVIAYYELAVSRRTINVERDSGIAMIKDVIRGLT